ncbi:MAG: tyrosine-type recombinase/integrase, partial [Chloroflexota bacterium]|nr:tyrosine-type recombinase/integrase [Chloroflexota bacterium]
QELGIEWTTEPRFQDLFFTAMDGEPLARNSFMYALRRICRAAGVAELAPHELRHTGVSLLISMGHNVKEIQDLAGHTSVNTTLDEYGHLFPSDVVAAMQALSDNLATNGPSEVAN